ncbi:MAG: hypothetical protein OEN01_15280 [Candidatus Krumholzibacteria bacterium]|nr:hypothetical protein [Candidatus Krumholzibacteria bacterium]
MVRPKFVILSVLAMVALALVSCSEEQSDPFVPVPDIPVPTNLDAVIGTDEITLSWDADAIFAYSGFAVYRSEDSGQTWSKIGAPAASPFIDATVRTGILYLYRVAGIDTNGVEGERSNSITVRASFFSMSINDGSEFTSQRDVLLRFSAPAGTQLVRYSQDPVLAGVDWELFQTLVAFQLSSGDGPKQVYAQFTDPSGFTTDTVVDTIILDTEASIQSTNFTPGPPVQLGATLHVVVAPTNNELDGFANITVQSLATTIVALDDGTAGDPVGGDGIYETDYTFSQTFRGVDLIVSATFTDAAGNRSAVVEFADKLSFTDPPAAVTLFPAEDSTTTSISLRWSESGDANFSRYEIYRDQSPAVSKDTSPRVATISSVTTTSRTDMNLQEAQTYYYVVYVVNDLDESTASNTRMAMTEDIPPTPVVLDPPSAIGVDRLTLTWSMNNNTDFMEYRVYRDTSPGVTDDPAKRVVTLTDRFQTFYDDTGLDTVSNTYYYRVYVFDKGGNSARSNEVSTP